MGGLWEVAVPTPTVKKDPGLVAATHPLNRLRLAPRQAVKTGTPVRAGEDGWEVAPFGENAMAFAGTAGRDGSEFTAYRTVTIQLDKVTLAPGRRLKITDIDDSGNLTFAFDPDGAYLSLSEDLVLMDLAR